MLNYNPFYCTAGGQVGDQGIIKLRLKNHKLNPSEEEEEEEISLTVIDCIKAYDDTAILILKPETALKNIQFNLYHIKDIQLNSIINYQTSIHHTATHILNSALNHLYPSYNIYQAGSLVNDQKLRFDFTTHKNINSKQIQRYIIYTLSFKYAEIKPKIIQTTYNDAINNLNAKQLINQKYQAQVQVIDISPNISTELCTGTHVKKLKHIYPFIITKYKSIASNIKRIEAICGYNAIQYIMKKINSNKDEEEGLGLSENNNKPKVTAIKKENLMLQKQLIKNNPIDQI